MCLTEKFVEHLPKQIKSSRNHLCSVQYVQSMTTILMMIITYVSVILFSAKGIDAIIGMNYGLNSKVTLMPSMVVDIFLQNNITHARIYTNREYLIQPFGGSGIELAITIYNPAINITSFERAKQYVQKHVVDHPTVDVRYIHIGNAVFEMTRDNKDSFVPVVDAFKYMNQAVQYFGMQDKIKVVMSSTLTGVLNNLPNNSRPSDADFKDDVKESMLQVLTICNQTNAPFMFDLIPLDYIMDYNMDIEYAFFDKKSKFIVKDVNGLEYTNMFDFVHDSFVWAMGKYGFGNIKLVCSRISWPTDAAFYANTTYAERFFKGLLPKVISDLGTPMRPGKPIDTYVHGVSDEKNNPSFEHFGRHLGLFRNNGKPKYRIDLSGQGRDIFPTSAKGIELMPPRWCIFNGNDKNWSLVQEQFDYACSEADCTSLRPGGSCGLLLPSEGVSYGFNSYFQSRHQAENACKFNGFGVVTTQNPSKRGCEFSIEMANPEQLFL